MGMVVEFRQQSGRMNAPVAVMGGKSADIVIFPGIRIERWAEPPIEPEMQPAKSGPAAGGKGRKRR